MSEEKYNRLMVVLGIVFEKFARTLDKERLAGWSGLATLNFDTLAGFLQDGEVEDAIRHGLDIAATFDEWLHRSEQRRNKSHRDLTADGIAESGGE